MRPLHDSRRFGKLTVMRLYLRLGLAMGGPFGVLMALLNDGTRSVGHFVLFAVISGGLFGTLMAAMLGSRHRRATRGQETPSDSSAAGTVLLPVPVAAARDICRDVEHALPKSEIKEASERHVRLAVRASRKSWGERVELDLSACVDNTTKVEITSGSTFRLTMIDYGKNRDNVDRIAVWLEHQAAARIT